MTDPKTTIPAYVDFTPGHAAHPEMREGIASSHRQTLEANLDQIISRQAQLPNLFVHNDSPSVKLVVDLLIEARTLYTFGYHYSCVAMCGIVVERIIKDIVRHSVSINANGNLSTPTPKAFDQLEHVDIRSLINFCAECGLLPEKAKSAAGKLGELRNKYAHARGPNPEVDALRAVGFLHEVIDQTVSVFKMFDMRDGMLVPKEAPVT